MKMVDQNKDGKVSKEEMKKILQSMTSKKD